MRFSFGWRLRHGITTAGLLAASLPAVSVSGQTLFDWPQVNVDVSRYTSYEECLVAIRRVADSVSRTSDTRSDTLPWSVEERRPKRPARVEETASRCSARFDASTADMHNFGVLAQVYLNANRTTSVDSLLTRRLSVVRNETERAYVLDTIVHLYLETNPIDFSAVDRYMGQLEAVGPRMEPAHWVRSLAAQLRTARWVRDTARADHLARLIVAFDKSVPEARKQMSEEYGMNMIYNVYGAHVHLRWKDLIESLRISTAQFTTLHRKLWAEASGARGDALVVPIGAEAKPLVGDFWFSPASNQVQETQIVSASNAGGSPDRRSGMTRPTPGKNSFVVFLGTECAYSPDPQQPRVPRMRQGPFCEDIYRVLRRMAARFPDLEVTIVAQTHGFFSRMDPPSPAVEAEFLRKWWLDFHKIPAVLTVTNTAFWRMPGLDKRRINEGSPNRMNYTVANNWQVDIGWGFLIDRRGIVIEAGEISRHTEPEFSELLGVLERRSPENR